MIFIDKQLLQVKKYSDGSLNIKDTFSNKNVEQITACIKNSDDLICLLLLKDILDFSKIILFVPYLPYSRSDRKTNTDGVCGIKAIASLINSLGFRSVKTIQPHSDVSLALINNLIVTNLYDYPNPFPNVDYLVTPDAGSMKFGEVASQAYNLSIVNAFKVRDTTTNQLTKTIIPDGEQLRGKKVMIMDDVCEYGTTFHNLAKLLKEEYGVLEVNLFLAHGVFPLNERVNPPSRFSFILQYVDNIYVQSLWVDPNDVSSLPLPSNVAYSYTFI